MPVKTTTTTDVTSFHIADLHIGSCRLVYNYMERTQLMCNAITSVVLNHPARNKVVVLAGDLLDGKMPTEAERRMALDFVLGFVSKKIHIVIINGNHDYFNEQGTTMLDMFHSIKAIEKKYLHIVTNDPRLVEISDFGISYLCVPCQQNLTTKKLQHILGELRSKAQYDVCYGVVHEALSGSMANAKHIMKTECGIPVIKSIKGIMLGDIHMRQKLSDGVWYCGSPIMTKYNDNKDTGMLVWNTRSVDPEVVLLPDVPRLIEITDPKKLKKYENTRHAVKYTGKERVEVTAPNVAVHPNLKAVTEAQTTRKVVEKTKHSALQGLKEFLTKAGLDESEILDGYRFAEKAVLK
jgi:DNA repair exonuclease SbcCD nuclease subunit